MELGDQIRNSQKYRDDLYKQGLSSSEVEKKILKFAEKAEAEMIRLLKEIKTYGPWRMDVIETLDTDIQLLYKYPNGRFGDIDDYLAKMIAKPVQVSDLEYQIMIKPKFFYEEMELLVGYYKQEFCANKVKQLDSNYNRSAKGILNRSSRWWELYGWHIDWRFGTTETGFCNDEIYRLIHDHYVEMKEKRNEIYNAAVLKNKVSARWSSEIIAYTLVHSHYSDAIFQYQPKWLGRQSLDIYIPSKKVAIEYQGEQHYYPVSLFDGHDGLNERKRRDQEKKRLCKENGVLLLEWKFNDPLSEDWFCNNMIPKIDKAEN